jgi:hypothetical protein
MAVVCFHCGILDSGVNHRGANMLVPQELLNTGDVHPSIERARSQRMT